MTVFGNESRIQVNHPPEAPAEKINGPLYSLLETTGLKKAAEKASVLMLRGIVQFSRRNNRVALAHLHESLRYSDCVIHKTHVLGFVLQLLVIESGLESGDRVIVNGLQKVFGSGMQVAPRDVAMRDAPAVDDKAVAASQP